MKLLIITQKVDINDDILSFFNGWIKEFAKHCESIIVICLRKGEYNLPENVEVLSLGKQAKKENAFAARAKHQGKVFAKAFSFFVKIKYCWNFYKYIWRERKNYDAVFVHMNQEYVLLGGLFWKIFGKKIFMWRNHPHGNFLTSMAIFLSNKVFCTSEYSFTARYKKTELMPVGIDTNFFKRDETIPRDHRSILFLGRIAPVKRPDMLIGAVALLKKKDILAEAHIYGNPASRDKEYFESLKKKAGDLGVAKFIHFYPGMPNEKTPAIYNQHGVFVNASPSGMYDKTIFEAMACESLALASNINLKGKIGEEFLFIENDEGDFVKQLIRLLALTLEEREKLGKILRAFVVSNHGLTILGDKLAKHLAS
ncbi:glycosyltransferase family 4 protein [Patescibacteria group bacterium]|nr:glycosyltransferase family 4 protein [Patescibacteria group bacterium]